MKFKFSDVLVVDSEVEPWQSEGIRIGFYSAPGTRKSYTVAACIIEPFLLEGGTVVVFEPRSEWHTLKQRFASVVVVGGPFQDVPLAVNHARVYAEAIVKNGASMVFDFVETEDKDLVKFAAELLQRIYTLQNIARRPLLVFFEELAEYAPFRTTGKLVEPWIYDRVKSRITKIATQGRPLGFNLAFTSQRPAQIDYTVRMMANLSFYGKFHPKDLNDIKQVLSAYDVPAKEYAEKCVNIPHGSWIAITASRAQTIQIITERLTPHGADTPKLEYLAPQTEETKKTVTSLTETITQALERERLEESELEKEREKAKKLQEEIQAKDKEIDRLKQTAETLGKIKIETPQPQVSTKPEMDIEKVRDFIEGLKAEVIEGLKAEVIETFDKETDVFLGRTHIIKEIATAETEKLYNTWAPKMPNKCARKIFRFLLDRRGAKYTKPQIAIQLGYKNTKGGVWAEAFRFLKQNNLIRDDGQYLWVE